MKYWKLIIFTLLFLLIGIGCVLAEGDVEDKKQQTTCPVMGDKIPCLILNKSIYLDYEEKRIYFCSMNCLLKFKKDPERYIKKLEGQGVIFEKNFSTNPKDELK